MTYNGSLSGSRRSDPIGCELQIETLLKSPFGNEFILAFSGLINKTKLF